MTNTGNNHVARLEAKLAGAYARQAESNKLNPAQKVARLDKQLGKGVGAVRERARLATRILDGKNGRKA